MSTAFFQFVCALMCYDDGNTKMSTMCLRMCALVCVWHNKI